MPLQILFQIRFCLQNFIKIDRLLLAAVSINGLTSNTGHVSGPMAITMTMNRVHFLVPDQ